MDLSFPTSTSVNDGIPKNLYFGEPYKLRYPSIDNLINLINSSGPECLLFKCDIQRCYRWIPVDPRDFHLLGITWRGSIFIDTKLPFGLRSSAMACQRCTNALMYIYRQTGHNAVNYIDDFAGATSPETAQNAYETLTNTITKYGFRLADRKCVAPTKCLTFLGKEFNTSSMTISIPEEKLRETDSILHQFSARKKCRQRELQSLVGKLVFIAECVRSARLFITRILQLLRTVRSKHHRIYLNKNFHKDIRWWIVSMRSYNGVSMIPNTDWSSADQLSTDACLTGCGAWLQQPGTTNATYFHVTFPTNWVGSNIASLELLTILVALRAFGNSLAGQRLVINCDNDASVSVLNTGAGRDPTLMSIARNIWLECANINMQIKATHIPGIKNSIADSLSRWHLGPQHSFNFNKLTHNIAVKEITIDDSDFKLNNDI